MGCQTAWIGLFHKNNSFAEAKSVVLQLPVLHSSRTVARAFLAAYLSGLECDEVNAVPGRVPSDASIRCANRYDGKQRSKASKSRGEPLMRIFRRSRAQTRLASLRRKRSHVWLSAMRRRFGVPVWPSDTFSVLF